MTLESIPYWVSYTILGTFALVAVYAINAPPRQPDPQRGMAVGCLLFLLLVDILVAIAFTIGILVRVRWLTNAITWLCLFAVLFVAIGLVESLVRALKKRR